MSKTIIIKCDICNNPASQENISIPVKFSTDQTEGRSVTPYLEFVNIDICKKCHRQIIDRQPLTGSGAMGHNKYTFNHYKDLKAENERLRKALEVYANEKSWFIGSPAFGENGYELAKKALEEQNDGK